jgi:hypothetical protein
VDVPGGKAAAGSSVALTLLDRQDARDYCDVLNARRYTNKH